VKDGKPTREFGCIKEACGPVRDLFEDLPANDFGPLSLQEARTVISTNEEGDFSQPESSGAAPPNSSEMEPPPF